ncbi:ATP-dependent helicase [Caproiciproducens galactitolivorans]|uniref:DNA 3'-5' helicase n=1 Tax=Caproiciproducens galactitolivorans TaxID=642589 RepID=A0ABT4BSX6_9FIRM|nr:UvrD-helicase domain-containing protein [Caproiciproducens galactitolivorans]MCY1714007.1 UvrD-helicase domain-containing protein [Caproiciproducens galactitolivorans]
MNNITSEQILELRRQVLNKEFHKMNDRQREAVFSVNGPLLILAGAGSGKTTVLVNRIANIIKYGNAYGSRTVPGALSDEELSAVREYIDHDTALPQQVVDRLSVDPCLPWQILAITFTNKAAGELKNRLINMLGEAGNDIWASTFHSTCARMLRRDGEKLGYSSHFTIYDTDDSRRMMKECQKALDIDDKLLSCKSILSAISHAKDSMVLPEEFMKQAGSDNRLCLIAKAYKLYQTRLREADAMDFDDLICNAVLLLEKNQDVLDHYQNKFHYVMVDEYQDTNHAQYMLVKLLAQKSGNLCVVGDDDQSIYKFRGATIENILSFESTFPNTKVIRLEQNYRSTKNILNAANAVIENNAQRKGKTLWTNNKTGEQISVHTAFSEQDEADFIAKKVLSGVAEGRKYSDYAILYRMNSQSNILEKIFVKSGIPYRIIGGQRFYERKEIKDMIAYLSVINNPNDEIRLRRIINQPKRSIGDKTVAQATEIAAGLGESVFEVIRHADQYEPLKRTAPKLLQFAAIMQELIDASNDENTSLNELYHLILDKTDYIASLYTSENDDPQDRIDNINELASNLIKYEEENGKETSLAGFLEEVSLITDIDNFDEHSDSVVMMTIHSAKGLEFPVVFLPGFEDGIFPGMQAIYNPVEIEEERRLAYVAITRAKEELYIVNAESRMIFGSTSRNKPSRFIEEIPEELVERSRSREWKKPQPGTSLPTSAFEARAITMESARSFGPSSLIHSEPPVAQFKAGDCVSHKTFGKGMVLSASPMGNDTLLEIAFDKVGTKKLMANFARLQRA